MDVRHLRNMLAVLEEGTLGRAALRLINMSQPALTKSIQRLEEQLGIRLFERGSKGMHPTFYAESLKNFAKAACIGMSEAETQIAALRNGTEGVVTIAGPPFTMTEFMPEIVTTLLKDRPRLQVRMIAQHKDLFADLLLGKFNLVVAMLYDEIPNTGLTRRYLFDDRLVLAMSERHPLASQGRLELKDLLDQRWVLGEKETWSHQRLKLYFDQQGLTLPKASIKTHDPAIAKSIIMTSDHIGVIPNLGIEKEIALGALATFEIDSPLMLRPIGIIHRTNEPMSPALTFFISGIDALSEPRRRRTRATIGKIA